MFQSSLVRQATEKREKAICAEGNTPVLSLQDICVKLHSALQADSLNKLLLLWSLVYGCFLIAQVKQSSVGEHP